ncbi:hypothetical protein ASC87_12595 [Rhizobacter sp. Root1221]|nr:hypothetical protein ASC87_12595 [Rhizobacter sp. Root1221]
MPVGPSAPHRIACRTAPTGLPAAPHLNALAGTTMVLVSHDLERPGTSPDQVLLLLKRPARLAEILRHEVRR